MKSILMAAAAAAASLTGGAALAGDPEAGEREFRRCRSCHSIIDMEGNALVRGGQTGPNLYGIVGRQIGAVEDFRYSDSLAAAGADGAVWDEASLAAFITDPKAWLVETLGDDGANSKMTFKMANGAEDMAAYLATLGN